MRAPATLSFLAIVLAAATPVAAEVELSFYLGAQSAPHSRIDGENASGDFDELIRWEGRSFDAPPYYGLRATWWTSETLGYGVEFNHAKVYSDEDDASDAGFSTLEFTDGINYLTANVWRRWPEQFGGLTPYVGAGLGLSIPHVETDDGENETFEYQITGPAATLTAGASYDLTADWSVFGEYKFAYSSNEADLDGGGTLNTDIVTNALNVGVSFDF